MKTELKDLVILLPGIMGSALAKNGRTLWDLSPGAIGRALATLGGSVQDLALDSDDSSGEGVTATHVLADLHLIPGLWKIDGYSGLSRCIQEKFEVARDANFFEFPYDWRLDNRIAARRLQAASQEWLERWRSQSRNPGARLVLIAHSMGGLVARYFLEVLGGWEDTRLLVTLGTPHRGALKALDYLVNGLREKAGPITLVDLTAMVRSFPSVHQLLPIYPCVGKSEHDLAPLEALDELGPLDLERTRAAIGFHREIERAVARNAEQERYRAARYKLLPVVGTEQPTFQSALITRDGLTPLRTYKGQLMLGGDGTVPRLSATPIELSNARSEFFAACPHASLQNFDPVQVQLRALLGDVDITQIKAVPTEPVSLELDDIFSSAEPIRIRARCEAALDPMRMALENLDTGETWEDEMKFDAEEEGWQCLERPPLPAGAYRVRIDAGGYGEPIADAFVVME